MQNYIIHLYKLHFWKSIVLICTTKFLKFVAFLFFNNFYAQQMTVWVCLENYSGSIFVTFRGDECQNTVDILQ